MATQADSNNRLVVDTLNNLFAQNQQLTQKKENYRRNANIKTRDLEIALTVLLVDLASCDQNFEPQEYTMIQRGLQRMFGTNKTEVQGLVNQAVTTLKNMRGSSGYISTLKENLPEDERRAILEVIDDVIDADGVEDGFETYLRSKFADLLGVKSQ